MYRKIDIDVMEFDEIIGRLLNVDKEDVKKRFHEGVEEAEYREDVKRLEKKLLEIKNEMELDDEQLHKMLICFLKKNLKK